VKITILPPSGADDLHAVFSQHQLLFGVFSHLRTAHLGRSYTNRPTCLGALKKSTGLRSPHLSVYTHAGRQEPADPFVAIYRDRIMHAMSLQSRPNRMQGNGAICTNEQVSCRQGNGGKGQLCETTQCGILVSAGCPSATSS